MSTKTITIGPKIKTALPGPNAKRVLEGDTKYISPSYTRSYPLVAKHGRGVVITDVDGNEFLDFSARIDSYVRYRLLLREHDHAGRSAFKDRAYAWPPQDLLRKLRRRGD